jgi:hypothetical protein
LTYQRVERQVTVPFHGGDQVGQDCFESFATDAISGLPEDNQHLTDCLRIGSPSQGGRLGDEGLVLGDEADRMLAMAVGERNEFIQDF